MKWRKVGRLDGGLGHLGECMPPGGFGNRQRVAVGMSRQASITVGTRRSEPALVPSTRRRRVVRVLRGHRSGQRGSERGVRPAGDGATVHDQGVVDPIEMDGDGGVGDEVAGLDRVRCPGLEVEIVIDQGAPDGHDMRCAVRSGRCQPVRFRGPQALDASGPVDHRPARGSGRRTPRPAWSAARLAARARMRRSSPIRRRRYATRSMAMATEPPPPRHSVARP